MANLDAPILVKLTATKGSEHLVAVKNGLEVQLPVNGVLGLLPSDVDSSVANTDTISTRLSIVTGTTPTVTLPSATGALREVLVLNSASGNATLDTPSTEKIFTATAEADTLVIATGKAARLLSDGTRWYHVSNDA